MNARIGLILAGLAFAIWEAVDIFWIAVPAAAAVFAALFLGCTLWFWRRDSILAVAALMVLFAFEAAAVPTLKHVMMLTKVTDFMLGIAGIALAVAVLLDRLRASSRPVAT
jgi:Na+/H+-dicarboxylate symporter